MARRPPRALPAGVVLSAEFDAKSPVVEQQIAAFTAKLAELQKEMGFPHYVRHQSREGTVLRVSIIPVSKTKGHKLKAAKAPDAAKVAAEPAKPKGWIR